MKKLSLFLLVGLVLILFLIAFRSTNFRIGKSIEISDEYILNDFWDQKYNHQIKIDKMIVLDDRLDVFSKDFIKNSSFWDFDNSLELDSTFSCSYWGSELASGKAYFIKDNGWNWKVNDQEKTVLGRLDKNCWYKFSNLKMNTKFYIYVFVDSTGATHQFVMNKANF